jgi:DNA-binding IclR family transcriptional regulator
METSEISLHLLKVFDAVKHHGGWITNAEIAKAAGVAPRTARAHSAKLVSSGLFDLAEVFPAHRYRLSDLAEKRNKAMLNRIDAARAVFK